MGTPMFGGTATTYSTTCHLRLSSKVIVAHYSDQILCVHGGMSPDIRALDQIREIDRKA